MKRINQAFKNGQAHHAYIIAGEFSLTLAATRHLLENDLGVDIRGNPDVFIREYGLFSIDDGRLIRATQKNRAFSGDRKFFILAINFITIEAQNTLLKTLEEPAAGSYFFILVRRPEIFLPTVLSRCEVLTFDGQSDGQPAAYLDRAEKFLSAKPAARLELVGELLAGDDHNQNKAEIIHFLDGLEAVLRQKVGAGLKIDSADRFKRIIQARRFIQARGGFPRLVLEDLALTI